MDPITGSLSIAPETVSSNRTLAGYAKAVVRCSLNLLFRLVARPDTRTLRGIEANRTVVQWFP